MVKIKKLLYYALNLTWGIPLNIIGFVTATVLTILGYRGKRYNGCIYYEVGNNWGGLEMGLIFVVNKNPNEFILNHEYGHSVQNSFFGPLYIPVIWIPSSVRYWIRTIGANLGKTFKTGYYDIWFEKGANDLGTKTRYLWK